MSDILDTNTFIKKVKQIHGNKYDYSLVEYTNSKTKVKIICNEHGIFEQLLNSHYHHGCKKCGDKNRTKKIKLTDFIKKAKEMHGNKYDYSLVEYINNKTKVKIICLDHGIFEQIPQHHYNHG